MTATKTPNDPADAALGRLERLISGDVSKKHPPVHLWDPEARPDIGLEIKHDGTWIHQGDPFTRQDLTNLFASVLRREPDGSYFLVTPAEKVPVRVEDVPFIAVELEVAGSGTDQKLIWRTNLDDVVIAGPENPIRFEEEPKSGGLKPYLTVRNGLEARVTRSLWYDLAELAEVTTVNDTEQFGVWSDGCFYAMAKVSDVADMVDDAAQL